MKPRAEKIKLSYEDFLELPNDGKRYQILDGELDMTPAPGTEHQTVLGRLFALLLEQESERNWRVFIAPTDVILDRHTIVEPDLVLVRAERQRIITKANIQGAPDLVVEVLSPNSRRTDRVTKKALYARFGIPAYWIVDPATERIECFVLEGKAYVLAREAKKPEVLKAAELGGFKVPLAKVFA